MTDILSCLTDLYGDNAAISVFDRIQSLIADYSLRFKDFGERQGYSQGRQLDQRDAILITYGDQVQGQGSTPLRVLGEFCKQSVADLIRGVHVLPFFPYSSDDGFSVLDYRKVNLDLGGWEDVARLGQRFRLMFDLVINHVSVGSYWFQGFLRDDPRYRDYFIVIEGSPDLSKVVRPRTSPLLTQFETSSGIKAVWTTFSADQVDLNYRNPAVLLEMIDTLLFYISKGADFIRLDAIAYLWKEIGTSCIHHPSTHRIVQLMRLILDQIAPWVILITETNVPHAANISYFGDGINEAQLVYNFALPPLVLHAFHSGDCRKLASWAASLTIPSQGTSFFNFLASHDGIGINPVRGILSEEEINEMVDKTVANGGLVSSKSNPDGTSSPYELNVNYFDALSYPLADEAEDIQIDRFICAQAIMLSMIGVPGIYFHSLFGSRGWLEGAQKTGQNRAINRLKFEKTDLEAELSNPNSRRSRVFERYKQLLSARANSPAFDPHGSQRVIDCGPSVFGLLRGRGDQGKTVLCLHNVTASTQTMEIDLRSVSGSDFFDLISTKTLQATEKTEFSMGPYQVMWLLTG